MVILKVEFYMEIFRYNFEKLGSPLFVRDDQGVVQSFTPQDRIDKSRGFKLHAYGRGLFCKFKFPNLDNRPGVYALQIDNEFRYVGQTINLAQRWGPVNYGSISPRNCFNEGQPTNCRINHHMWKAGSNNADISLWFLEVTGGKPDLDRIENELIYQLDPIWNKSGRRPKS